MRAILYLPGKGGNAGECAHYRPLFPGCEICGLDYRTFTPWETGAEIRTAVEDLKNRYKSVTLIANSIGAFFALHAGLNGSVDTAYFISPVLDMARMIRGMMAGAGITEADLKARGTVCLANGETLSWDYLSYVLTHPVEWRVPTHILIGGRDALVPPQTAETFAETCGASLTVMKDGEHWFHTGKQLRFLDKWLSEKEKKRSLRDPED